MADRFQFRAGPEEDGHPLADGLARRQKLAAADARALVKNGGVRCSAFRLEQAARADRGPVQWPLLGSTYNG